MLFLTVISALTGLSTALAIPHDIDARQTGTVPALTNYTGTYLRNLAIQPQIACRAFTLGVEAFPLIQQTNVTKCRDACESYSTQRALSGSNLRCRSFNAYMLLKDGVSQGLQCVLYDRKFDNIFATNNGSLTAWGEIRPGQDVKVSSGVRYDITDSYAYYLTKDLGDQSCGNGMSSVVSSVVASVTGVKVTASVSASASATVTVTVTATASASFNANPAAVLNGANGANAAVASTSMCSVTTGYTTRVTTITLTTRTTGTQCTVVPVTTTRSIQTTTTTTSKSTTKIVQASVSGNVVATVAAQATGMVKIGALGRRGGQWPSLGGSGSMPQYGEMESEIKV